jgi:hypothetical protein
LIDDRLHSFEVAREAGLACEEGGYTDEGHTEWSCKGSLGHV